MVTEFEIRREFSRIDASDHAPLRKARMMLRLARRVRVGAARLAQLSYGLMQDCMNEQGSRMQEASRRLCDLHDDIRARAAEVLYGPRCSGSAMRRATRRIRGARTPTESRL